MADVDHQQGGPSTSRRQKHAGKSKSQPGNDWPRAREPRSRASPRSKRHGDIDRDIVESSDDVANDAKASPRKHRRRRRSQPLPSSTASDTASDTTAPAKAPQRPLKGRSKSMRVPNASVPVLDTAPAHRRPTCIIEEDDDDDAAPSRPSRPVSRQTIARRDPSARSTHRYRSTPESRRSPRTSVSDSEDNTDATSESDEEQVIRPRSKPFPAVPIAPAVPSAPPAPAVHSSLQERLRQRPEMVYEEEEEDGTSRYAPSVARHRSLSRPPSSRQDRYRRPTDITISGPPSLDETRRSRSRSKSARRSRKHYESDVYVSSRPASSFKRPHAASSYSLSSSAKRSTYFGADFAGPAARPLHLENPAERTTVCVRCRDTTIPVSRTAKLKCLHRMCHSCLRDVFSLSLTDPVQHMPPRCCTKDHIPSQHVKMLFDPIFMKEWNRKYREHNGRKGNTCPSRRCGEVLKPEDMRFEGGRWQARCSRCRTKICGSCSGRWHPETQCPRDGEVTQFPEQARREPWQRCYRCKTKVEIKDGRNHMTCRCGAEFCLVCGGKWKTCDCPWHKYDPLEADTQSRSNPFTSRPSSPRELRSDFVAPAAPAARVRPSSYEEDAHIRRLHEQRDDHLARRMHSFDAFGHHSERAELARGDDYDLDEPRVFRDRRRRRTETRDYDTPFLEDDYHRRAATVVAPSPPQAHAPAAPPPPRSAFEPPSRPAFDRPAADFDYSPAVHRSRGARYASPERYDDYVTENYPPEKRRARSPDPWEAFAQERRPRSRDRRNTFPTESRPTSPDTWQLPTRYPSLERPVPAPEEKRRAPSPERRRASSLEKRLAGRFKKESRQSPAAPVVPVGAAGAVGAVGPIGAVEPLGPITPSRVPPTASRAATHVGVGMPMAPIPPPVTHAAPPVVTPLRRHHTMGEDMYAPAGVIHGSGGGGIAPADWFGPPLPHGHPHAHPAPAMGMPMMHPGHAGHHHPHLPHHPHPGGGMHDVVDMAGGSPRAPNVRRRPPQGAHREHAKHEAQPSSVLAGLGGMGRGMHRVSQWVNFVEPGLPEDTATVVQ